jgi:hypothetical protein
MPGFGIEDRACKVLVLRREGGFVEAGIEPTVFGITGKSVCQLGTSQFGALCDLGCQRCVGRAPAFAQTLRVTFGDGKGSEAADGATGIAG